MKRKALMSFCILTVLAILFVSFLLLTVGPAHSVTPGTCKIFPNNAAARLEHCSKCASGDTEAYCGQGDCNCANNQCSYWVYQSPGLCTDIHVCGAVCTDTNAMPFCSISTGSPMYYMPLPTGRIEVTCPCPGSPVYVPPTVPVPPTLLSTVSSTCPCPCGTVCGGVAPSNVSLFGKCDFDPYNLTSSDKQCKGDYICCRNATMSSTDGYCDRREDGKCDPDCPLNLTKFDPSYDPDCIKGKCIVPADLDRNCKVDIIDIFRIARVFGCNEQEKTPCGKWSSPKFT